MTTAVLSSVDAQHAGAASGLNSSFARTGTLIASALVGEVLAARGDLLVARIHYAAVTAAITSILAAVIAFWGLRPSSRIAG